MGPNRVPLAPIRILEVDPTGGPPRDSIRRAQLCWTDRLSDRSRPIDTAPSTGRSRLPPTAPPSLNAPPNRMDRTQADDTMAATAVTPLSSTPGSSAAAPTSSGAAASGERRGGVGTPGQTGAASPDRRGAAHRAADSGSDVKKGEVNDGGMKVQKRNGSFEPVDLNKIVRAVSRCAEGLAGVDSMRIATRTISGLYDGASTSELDRLSIQTAASLTAEEPQYSKLAARLLATYIDKEVQAQEIQSFSQSIKLGHELGLINDRTADIRDGQRAEAERHDRSPTATGTLRVLRPADGVRPLPPEAPRGPQGHRDAAVLLSCAWRAASRRRRVRRATSTA